MSRLFNRIGRRLLAALGVVVIVLALALGAFRLLIARLPSYQSELQAWVADELGFEIAFEELDARLGIYGPELTFYAASIGRGERPFVEARRAGVVIDPWRLVLERRVSVSRLTLDGVVFTLERTADGSFHLPGLPPGMRSSGLAALVPPEVEVVVRDSQLLYIDLARRRSWQFLDVALELDRDPEQLAMSAQARPPTELAGDVGLDLAAELGTDGEVEVWRVSSTLHRLDLGVLARLLPTESGIDVGGSGDISLSAVWTDGHVASAGAELSLANVALGNQNGAAASYDRFAVKADWRQAADRSWRLGLAGLELEREGRAWPADGSAELSLASGGEGIERVSLRGDFVRLEDLSPLLGLLEPSEPTRRWAELEPRGDLSGIDLAVARVDGDWNYAVSARVDGLGFDGPAALPAMTGLSGEIRADTRGGTVTLESRDVTLEWPSLFRTELATEGLRGSIVWRRGRNVLRVIGNDIAVGVLGRELAASFDLSLPGDGTSPRLDLAARLPGIDLVAAKQYLPAPKMPAGVVEWLDAAVQGGAASDIVLDFFGPLAAFPFDGHEGQFRVTADVSNAVLAFMPDWPRAEALDGRIEFVNAGFSARGSGRVFGNASETIDVGIGDMRAAVLTVAADTRGPLADVVRFVHEAPLISRHLGAAFDRVRAEAGEGLVSIDLRLPLLDLDAYTLKGSLTFVDGTLALEGFVPTATEINGRLDIDEAAVTADAIESVFLGGSVKASVRPPGLGGYRALMTVEGETTTDAVLGAFGLPFKDLFGGQTLWTGSLLLPSNTVDDPPPLRVDVESNLSGVALRFPQPLTKPASEPTNLKLGFVFAPGDRLEVEGNLGATRRFVLDYGMGDDGLHFERGAVTFGGGEPLPPLQDGILVNGRLPELDLSDWLALAKSSSIDRARPLFLGAELDIAEFRAFGQRLGSTHLEVNRADRAWRVDIDSEAIAGRIMVPRDLAAREQIVADMQRVYLALEADENIALGGVDPRSLPGLRLRAEAFGFGTRRLGRLDAEVTADPLGLRLDSFASRSSSYEAEGSGSWLVGPRGSITRIAATIGSSDVAATLGELGMDQIVEGETGDVTGSVYWNGPPSGRWLDHLNGDVSLSVEKGSLVELDPGAGRVLGLMSIAALPRRLALDFRDVFNKGFAFDDITGSFTIIDGNAYTNNLKMSGPSAEIGVIGRTGLRDRDYQQQAVVTAEPSNMLPTVGGLLGGPGVGAALLIFTRIFKEPLKGIGRASYCVTGPWEAPAVERISNDELERAEACVELPAAMSEVRDE